MELIKRHKGLAIMGGLSLILLLVILFIFYDMIFTNGSDEYGNRLDNIVKIDKSETNKLTSEIKELEEVNDVKVRIQGKIIYITITYKENVSRDKAKEIGNKTITYYNKEVLEDYDFELLLVEEKNNESEEDKSFKIAGTKHPNIDYISWTRG